MLWYTRIQYLFNEQEVLETLTSAMIQLERGNSTEHHRDMEAYYSQVKKDWYARFIMLSIMHNDLIGKFENCPIAKGM